MLVQILIYDIIGEIVKAENLIKEYKEKVKDGDKVEVLINSPGGDIFEAIAIYNFLKEKEVDVVITSLAASAASFIAMAGKNVRIMDNAFLMIHKPWTFAVGDSDYMKKVQDNLEMLEDVIVKAYSEKTGKDKSEILALMQEEKWFTAREAKEFGFVDEVIDSNPKNMVTIDEFQGVMQEKDKISARLHEFEKKLKEKEMELEKIENLNKELLQKIEKYESEKIDREIDKLIGEGKIYPAEKEFWKNEIKKNWGVLEILEKRPPNTYKTNPKPPAGDKKRPENLMESAVQFLKEKGR
ncbi:MAG: Clp protease ClpP [Archaeoglobus sp.]|nr:Clp protease ClpP [Archaeoglobus sp.]